MRTLALLLWKDLRRAWRNPVGWLVFLAIPLLITALIGLAFGPKSSAAGLGRIRFALVDEDDSPLTRFLRGALGQRESSTNLEALVLDRAEALRQVSDNKLSALVVIPAGFTRSFLTTTNVVTFELVKNPAESIHPAVLEELLGALVTGLDAIKRHLGPELPAWQALFDGRGDYHRMAELIVRAGDKIEAARKLLFPPRVTYTRQTATPQGETRNESSALDKDRAGPLDESRAGPRESSGTVGQNNPNTAGTNAAIQKSAAEKPPAPPFNLFAYLLPGMASMFLLFLAENASRDVQRELQQRTLQRFRTLHHQLYSFVASKAVFCLVFLLLASFVMLGGGGLIFRIHWRNPLAVIFLTAGYCLFAGGLMTLLPALVREPRAAQVLSNVTASLVGMVGGSAFPAHQLPALLRDHVCPWLPNYWYTEAMRSVVFDANPAGWGSIAARSALLGAVLMLLAAVLLRRGLERGARA